MPGIENLFHELDKQQSNFEIKATQILDDHSKEISKLRDKMDGLWLKIFMSIGTIVGAAMVISRLL